MYFRFHLNTLCMLLLLIGYKWFCVFLSQDTYNISRYIIVKEQYKYFSVFTRFLSVLKKFSTWQIDLKFHSLHNWQIVFLQRMCTYKILVDSFYLFFSKLHFKNLLFFDLKRYLALMNTCKCVLCNIYKFKLCT